LRYGDRLISTLHDSDACPTPARVFVPLCGKTVDLAFFAKADAVSEVVGVDGVRKALEEFAQEHTDLKLAPLEDQTDEYERLVGEKIALLKGDFFHLDEKVTNGRFDAIFDRASIVAIDPSLREEYVNVLSRLIQPGGRILLVVIERKTGTDFDMQGPPFSVPETEVRRLYENQSWVESVTLIEEEGEKGRNTPGSGMNSLYFIIQTK
jgi:thiopurine S-methyltransferase